MKGLTKKDLHGLVILAITGTGLIGLIVGAMIASGPTLKFDADTLCPSEIAYDHIVILIDSTDPLSESQKAFLESHVRSLPSSMAQFERLSLFVMQEPSAAYPTPEFSVCNPGTGDAANALYQNAQLIQQRFESRFGNPLTEILTTLPLDSSLGQSPIMQMIEDVMRVSRQMTPESNIHLIVVSDMLENTPAYSQYRDPTDFDWFRSRARLDNQASILSGTQISILYLLRRATETRQTRGHVLFWERYFDALGGRLIEVRPVI